MSSKTHAVIWSQFAQDDLQSIIEFIEIDNKQNAFRIFEIIKKNCIKIEQHPNVGRILPELKDINIETYRELVIQNWRVIYRVSDKEIFILAVIDSRRDIDDTLLRRVLNRN